MIVRANRGGDSVPLDGQRVVRASLGDERWRDFECVRAEGWVGGIGVESLACRLERFVAQCASCQGCNHQEQHGASDTGGDEVVGGAISEPPDD